nr:unnamed protein product [Spirometra erinaceieuropaei]
MNQVVYFTNAPDKISGMRVAIYSDFGAAALSVKQLLHCLQDVLPSLSVFTVKSEFVIKNSFSDCDLFCVGGGFSRGVVQSMTDVGLANLKTYVRSGGKYLGICSGAYLASRLTEFAVGSPLEIVDAGYLNFFDGIARGPLYKDYVYNSEKGSCAARVEANECIQTALPPAFVSYFNGGCEFLDVPSGDASVLYHYSDLRTPAIIRCRFGEGEALLSGIHFEFDPFYLAEIEKDPYFLRILPKLKAGDPQRKQFCKAVLEDFLN